MTIVRSRLAYSADQLCALNRDNRPPPRWAQTLFLAAINGSRNDVTRHLPLRPPNARSMVTKSTSICDRNYCKAEKVAINDVLPLKAARRDVIAK